MFLIATKGQECNSHLQGHLFVWSSVSGCLEGAAIWQRGRWRAAGICCKIGQVQNEQTKQTCMGRKARESGVWPYREEGANPLTSQLPPARQSRTSTCCSLSIPWLWRGPDRGLCCGCANPHTQTSSVQNRPSCSSNKTVLHPTRQP
jgi:hypothetical protein